MVVWRLTLLLRRLPGESVEEKDGSDGSVRCSDLAPSSRSALTERLRRLR